MITVRVDVDYAYASRFKSFCRVLFYRKKPLENSVNYLSDASHLLYLLNSYSDIVKVYWFFTPYTIPDKTFLELMDKGNNEVALHVATNPVKELERLKALTGIEPKFYTVHGTERLLARFIWHRKLWQKTIVLPKDFGLASFYAFPTFHLDFECYHYSYEMALTRTLEAINDGKVIHVHPDWFYKTGIINHRGRYVEVLRSALIAIKNSGKDIKT